MPRGIRSINPSFTDEEYGQLVKVKGEMTWHDFIMTLIKRKGN